jgi:hypothetical protein
LSARIESGFDASVEGDEIEHKAFMQKFKLYVYILFLAYLPLRPLYIIYKAAYIAAPTITTP